MSAQETIDRFRSELAAAGTLEQLQELKTTYLGKKSFVKTALKSLGSMPLAKQDTPDTSAYTDPEIAWRVDKKNHVGFVLRSPSHERIKELIPSYMEWIGRDFFATLPAPSKPVA